MRIAGRLIVVAISLLLATAGPVQHLDAQTVDSHFFPETGHTVKGALWTYWQEHGALAQQGYPLSEELQEKSDTDGKTYTVQYFERAVFEYHPEFAPPNNVLLSLLGIFRYRQKYPGASGAPGQAPNADPGTVFFQETGKHLGGSFLSYWLSHGGLAQQGYPISEEFKEKSDLNGQIYTVQYFERAVFEFHPENQLPYKVLLSQLGTFRYQQKHPGGTPSSFPPPGDWTAPVNVSNSNWYDNMPWVAVSPTDGAVSIGWEQRDEFVQNTTNRIVLANNGGLGQGLRSQVLATNGFKQSGGVRVRHDPLGRRHMIWWAYTPDRVVCDYYARIEANGSVSVMEAVPNTCGKQMKGTALAIGPDSSVHALFGKDNTNALYYERTDSGWSVKGETVVSSGTPTHLTIVVSSGGVVMAAYRNVAPSGVYYDIFAATRKGPNSWATDDISSICCTGCPDLSTTYLPALAADLSGGIRASWADEQCDPRSNPRHDDLYYREWLPGKGWTGSPVRIVRDPGNVYASTMVVDSTGMTHIVYESDINVLGDFRLYYVSGSGSSFSAPVELFPGWSKNGAFKEKEPTLDYSRGYLHLVFTSEKTGNKEVYYTYRSIGR